MKPIEGETRYKHLQIIGVLPRSVPLAKNGPNYTVKSEDKFLYFKNAGYDTQQIEEESSYERVRALERNAWISIDKCDVGPYQLEKDPIFIKTMSYMDIILEPVLRADMNSESNEIKMGASPGLPYTMHKIKSKDVAFQSEIYKDLQFRTDYIPLASIATKDEFLPMEDLKRDKVRTTFSTPLEQIMRSKVLFGQQNINIKNNTGTDWIQYGMTKQYGGLDRFFKRLEKFSHVFKSDISGYDRVANLFHVYYLRWKHLSYHEKLDDFIFHNMFHSICPFVVAPNGEIMMRQTGNNSGSNNTASDNSILHEIIIIYLFIFSFEKKNHRFPTISEIFDNAYVGLYSDDKMGGANFKFFGWETIEEFEKDEREVYSRFGMIIKASATKVSENKKGYPIDPEMEFLGSTAYYNYDHKRYMGYPRVGKICSSITRLGMSNLDEVQYFSKVIALAYLATPVPWLFKTIMEYLQFLINRSNTPSLLRSILSDLGGETEEDFLYLHLGYEKKRVFNRQCAYQSSLTDSLDRTSLIFCEFNEQRGGGGFKNMTNQVSRGENILNRLVVDRKITPTGKDWLVAALDPFHDHQLKNLAGWPDVQVGASVVRCVKQSVTIQVPAGVQGNWDCHIVQWPWLTGTNEANNIGNYSPATRIGQNIRYATGPGLRCGGLQVYYVPTGQPLGITGSNGTQLIASIDVPTQFTRGVTRMIGGGFEVHNTTSQLNCQGSVCVYRQMANENENITWSMTDRADRKSVV